MAAGLVDVLVRAPPSVRARAWPALARTALRALDDGSWHVPIAVFNLGLHDPETAARIEEPWLDRCVTLAERDANASLHLRWVLARWMELHAEVPAWAERVLARDPTALQACEPRALLRLHLHRPTVASWVALATMAQALGDFAPVREDFGDRAEAATRALMEADSDRPDARVQQILARWSCAWAKRERTNRRRTVATLLLRASHDRLTLREAATRAG